MCACQLTIKILIVMFLVASDELSGDGSAGDGSLAESDVLEILYSASMTEEDYRNFRQQQGLLVELKDFPIERIKKCVIDSYQCKQIKIFHQMTETKAVVIYC